MNIGEIIKDALRYPLSDWKKILILGIIISISGIADIALSHGIYVLSILVGIAFLIGFLVNGYLFRILKSSLDSQWELPGFNDWTTMFIDGFKVFAVFFVYLILPVLVVLFLLLLNGANLFSGSFYATDLASTGLSPLSFFVDDVTSLVSEGILSYPGLFFIFGPEIIAFLFFIYTILIIPVFLMAISNMAYYKGEFNSAFGFREIFDDIISIGWINLIKWYIATGIIFLGLFVVLAPIASLTISDIFSLIQPNAANEINLGWVIMSLTIIPYSYMFSVRALALFYKPEEELASG